MKQIASLLLTTTFTLIAPPAYADVNMMEASFRTKLTDADINGLKIQRRYDSRSNFSGLFGFGWCSTFDTHLEFAQEKDGRPRVQVSECGRTSTTSVHYKDQTYSQTLPTGLTRTYDADTGQLIRLSAGGQPAVAIERSRNRLPRAAALGEGLKGRHAIHLTFDDLGENVVSLETPDQTVLEFTYSSDRNLLSAKNAWANTYRFEYDSLHNLVHTVYPDKTFEEMTYDADHDRLLSFRGRDGCEETYSHTLHAEIDRREQTSTARLTCPSKSGPITKREAQFKFLFLRQKNSKWILSKMSLTRDGVTQTTTFARGAK